MTALVLSVVSLFTIAAVILNFVCFVCKSFYVLLTYPKSLACIRA